MEELSQALENIQKKLNISTFNQMQMDAIEFIPNGADTLLIANTGSGKTLAFLIPLMLQLDKKLSRTQLLIITPSRELALQIANVAQSMAMGFNIQTCYGGHPVRYEKKALESNPEIIVGTPGRILDHLERENIDPYSIQFVVLDEFDKTLEMGFHKQMKSIILQLRFKPQYILTSATNNIEIPDFIPLQEPQFIKYTEASSLEGLKVHLVVSPEKDKLETINHLIHDVGNDSTFIFCNYRETVERVHKYLKHQGIKNDFLHGGLDQIQRENAMSKFRNGSTRILVTTDLASRGLDIPLVENIIHYHFPITEEIYTHRNGRTARMNAEGKAFIIKYSEEELPEYMNITKDKFIPSEIHKNLKESNWKTLIINKGKRDNVNKVDVVGFLSKLGGLSREELGLVEIKKKYALAAVNKNKVKNVIRNTNNQKLKGKKAIVKEL